MAIINHAVGDDATEKGFNGCEESDGGRGANEILEVVPIELRHVQSWQSLWNSPETAADGGDVAKQCGLKHEREDRADNESND